MQERSTTITVNDQMQRGYIYERSAGEGEDFAEGFQPELTPAQRLSLGVFCGKYMTDCAAEFPSAWLEGAKLASGRPEVSLNYFGVKASQPTHFVGHVKDRRCCNGPMIAAKFKPTYAAK